MEPHQQIKWAGNGDGSNVRLGVRWTLDYAQGVLSNRNYMEPHEQMKWAGNGDGSNVRLGVRWTRESLDYAQGVLSIQSNMEPHQQIKWAGYRRNVRLGIKWARNSLGYNQGVLSNLGNSLQLILRPGCSLHVWSAHQQIKSAGGSNKCSLHYIQPGLHSR